MSFNVKKHIFYLLKEKSQSNNISDGKDMEVEEKKEPWISVEVAFADGTWQRR